MSIFLLTICLLAVLDLVWWRLSDRWLKGQKTWRAFNFVFLSVQFFTFSFLILGRVIGIRWSLPTPLMSLIYLWHLLILPILLIVGVCALPVLLFFLIRRLVRPRIDAEPALRTSRALSEGHDSSTVRPVENDSGSQTRRQFLLTTAVMAPPLINIALTGFSEGQLEQFRVREMTLAIADLPPALSGTTICHVTDLHVGPFTSEKVIKRVSEKINTMHADLVLFTGDLINSKLGELPLGVEFIRSLDSRYGVVTIEGNHDLFEGRAAFENAFRAAGLQLLVNESETLLVRDHPVQLLGLRWGGPGENALAASDNLIEASMSELLHQRDPEGAFPILLAHHPHAFDAAVRANLPLTLAGHTHGGQLMLNPQVGAGPLIFRYWSGIYQRHRSQLVVGNGVGNWFPLRTAAPAEIIQLTLRRA